MSLNHLHEEQMMPVSGQSPSPADLADDILAFATVACFDDVIRLLDQNPNVDLKEHINIKNNCGCTALLEAALYGHVEAAKRLIKAGADVNASETAGEATALIWAASGAKEEFVRFLLEAGADPWRTTTDKATALDKLVRGSAPPERKASVARLLVPAMFVPRWWADKTPGQVKDAWDSTIPQQWRRFATHQINTLNRDFADKAHPCNQTKRSPACVNRRLPAFAP